MKQSPTYLLRSPFESKPMQPLRILLVNLLLLVPLSSLMAQEPLRVAIFKADATPEIGMPVAYVKARSITDPLSVRGIVLMGQDKPIVLCAVDWIAYSQGGYEVQESSSNTAAEVEIVLMNGMKKLLVD